MLLEGLTDADLMRECGTCEGTGRVYNPAWERYDNAIARDFPQVPEVVGEYEREVPEPPQEPERIRCRECEGRGALPTPAGQTILDFLGRFR